MQGRGGHGAGSWKGRKRCWVATLRSGHLLREHEACERKNTLLGDEFVLLFCKYLEMFGNIHAAKFELILEFSFWSPALATLLQGTSRSRRSQ